MNCVECHNLTKVYKRLPAINELSFAIKENTITGLIGRNGAGKTTLLKLLAGFLRPTSGDIRVFSRNPFNNLTVSANMIFIDDQMAFDPSFRLTDILKSVGNFYQGWNQDLAMRLLDYFSLDPKQSHDALSKGMRSTFNVIVGIASHAPLTILDEPTTGMDSAVRKDFYRALLKDYLEYPRTLILSSHLLSEIEDLLEDVLLIKEGTKCLHLPILELKEYALGLRGNSQDIERYIDLSSIIYRESFGKDSIYVVIKNNLNPSQRQQMSLSGVHITPVSADEVCGYLTAKTQGGIKDVFRR